MPEQRLRVWFRKGERVRYISHLDVMRYWERAIRRAGLPLSYSQGYTPHPKITFAGPLPLGFLAEREPMDVLLDERMRPDDVRAALEEQSSEDLTAIQVEEVPQSAPALQASLRRAGYEVDIAGLETEAARAAVRAFLDRDELVVEEQRKDRTREVDLRKGVTSLEAEPLDGGTRLRMELSARQDFMIRPELVVQTLFPEHQATRITRTTLELDEPSPARRAWMKKGRFQQ